MTCENFCVTLSCLLRTDALISESYYTARSISLADVNSLYASLLARSVITFIMQFCFLWATEERV
ncbi:MAG: hypothetical protein B7X97_08835 [Methylotenera sp. 17-45-7]|nr:MAG: hypothetical protein B7Y72_07295 [Mehylophilales bacterium 35-46-6]OYY82998.1 MAG: hypothetical protein B7Y34_02145 [Methylophilales bacterium 16-45-9]OZA07608.1 MAG: hypothetical protein B7X97_08835 [Methylotenera sp. 17-45-7]